MDITQILFLFIGGLGLFLFGLRFMSDGLQSVAGDRMRMILKRTRSPSSLYGYAGNGSDPEQQRCDGAHRRAVNAEMLTLRQAIGVIMGANRYRDRLPDWFQPAGLRPAHTGLGALIYLFTKVKRTQMVGQTLFGFGVLFFGLSLMGTGMGRSRTVPALPPDDQYRK